MLVEEQLSDGTFAPSDSTVDDIWTSSSPRRYSYMGFGSSPQMRPAGGDSITQHGASVQRGACGLSNLGNTCFMNSMVQCLAQLPPLADKMVSDKYKEDLNVDNPLGMKGQLVEAFASVVKLLWSNAGTSVAPRGLKWTISQHAPQFEGYQQHDSQELMTFLLDGVHEDLNRVREKPYLEQQERGDRPDREAAGESWQGFKSRNNSLVVDNMYGQFKSTIRCPACDRLSVTFDPYSNISVPLTAQGDNKKAVNVTLVRSAQIGAPGPVASHLVVSTQKGAPVSTLLRNLSELANVSKDQLICVELFNDNVYKFMDGTDDIDNITDGDFIVAYEVPDVTAFEQHAQAQNSWNRPSATEESSSSALGITLLHRKDAVSYGAGLFGTPRLLSFEEPPTNAELHRTVRHCYAGLLGEAMPVGQLHLEKVDKSGHAVGSRYNYTNSGISALIPDDEATFEPPSNDSVVFVAVDWPRTEEGFASHSKLDFNVVANGSRVPAADGAEKPLSIGDCLELFGKPETLGEDDTWYCNKCKGHVQAIKQMEIWSLPPVLVMHLKRFSYSKYHRDKLEVSVDYPIEGLDMSGYCLGGAIGDGAEGVDPLMYDLMAVSQHHGGLGGGHYTAVARSSIDGKWYSFDDSHVSEARPNDIVTSSAYVLFYVRRNLLQHYLANDWYATAKAAIPADADDTAQMPPLSIEQPAVASEASRQHAAIQPFFEDDDVVMSNPEY